MLAHLWSSETLIYCLWVKTDIITLENNLVTPCKQVNTCASVPGNKKKNTIEALFLMLYN